MIKTIVTARVNKLLNELEEIATKTANNAFDAQQSMSVIQQAIAQTLPPTILKRILSIQNELHILGYIFNKADKC
jgi:hypothetical protein